MSMVSPPVISLLSVDGYSEVGVNHSFGFPESLMEVFTICWSRDTVYKPIDISLWLFLTRGGVSWYVLYLEWCSRRFGFIVCGLHLNCHFLLFTITLPYRSVTLITGSVGNGLLALLHFPPPLLIVFRDLPSFLYMKNGPGYKQNLCLLW